MSPTLEGPLFSLGAHGALGRTLTYKQRGPTSTVGIYSVPDDPRTLPQQNHRSRYLDAARLWQLMTDADRLDWTQQHQLAGQTAYNVWMQTVYKRLTVDHMWKNPQYQADPDTLENFLLIHNMQLMNGNQFLDISGNHRHWEPTNTTQEQGDRDAAALVTVDATDTEIVNGQSLGDLPAATIAIRTYTSTPQGSLGTTRRLLGYYSWGHKEGLGLYFSAEHIIFRVGDGVDDFYLESGTLYTPDRWNNLVGVFDASDSGRMKIFLNGEEIANETTACTKAGNNAVDLFLGGVSEGNYWPGYLDNATLYAGATDAKRI